MDNLMTHDKTTFRDLMSESLLLLFICDCQSHANHSTNFSSVNSTRSSYSNESIMV